VIERRVEGEFGTTIELTFSKEELESVHLLMIFIDEKEAKVLDVDELKEAV
jgi:hypothetical protein